MGPNLNLFIKLLKYHKVILGEFSNNDLKYGDSKEELVNEIGLLFDKVLLDIENALKSQKKRKRGFR